MHSFDYYVRRFQFLIGFRLQNPKLLFKVVEKFYSNDWHKSTGWISDRGNDSYIQEQSVKFDNLYIWVRWTKGELVNNKILGRWVEFGIKNECIKCVTWYDIIVMLWKYRKIN